ncbi:MAG: hypothetical protein SVR08_03140 [Spirochaetota bacterium]|nr:hypothetical protein [Spirochaetota bacterium]
MNSKSKIDKADEIERFREFVRELPDDSFDGHTEFKNLTPEQKLLWLSQAAEFYYSIKKIR